MLDALVPNCSQNCVQIFDVLVPSCTQNHVQMLEALVPSCTQNCVQVLYAPNSTLQCIQMRDALVHVVHCNLYKCMMHQYKLYTRCVQVLDALIPSCSKKSVQVSEALEPSCTQNCVQLGTIACIKYL